MKPSAGLGRTDHQTGWMSRSTVGEFSQLWVALNGLGEVAGKCSRTLLVLTANVQPHTPYPAGHGQEDDWERGVSP